MNILPLCTYTKLSGMVRNCRLPVSTFLPSSKYPRVGATGGPGTDRPLGVHKGNEIPEVSSSLLYVPTLNSKIEFNARCYKSLTDLSDVEMDLALCNQIVPFPRGSFVARRNRLWQSFTMPAPGIATTILVGFMGLLFLLCRKGRIRKARLLELLAASAGGLLSSSCCAVQVLLNTFSIGCAGFAALDHLRPFFISLTFSSLIYKTIVYDLRTYKQLWRSSPSWLVAVILTMFPTIMRKLNRGMGLRELTMLSGSLPCENKAASPTVILQYKVEGMKCEACANGLKLALQALQSDVRARVFYEKGIVFLIRMQKGADPDVETARDLEQGVAQVMKERGYRCRLERTALSL